MHPNTKNLSGKTFSRLTAIKIVEKHEHTPTKRRGTFWLCKCECGNKFENSKLYKGVGKLAQSKFSHIEWGAKKRGFEFLITKEYAWSLYEKQNGKCFYTQLPINLNTRNYSMTASIDRIDSNKGYIEDNIVWVHKDINIMKNKFSKEYFLMLCKKIVENHG